ncbi:hypothetical protein ACFL0Y_03000 [Patescibacteria group bacterium]
MGEKLMYCQFRYSGSRLTAMIMYESDTTYPCLRQDGSGFISTADPTELVSDEDCENQRKDGFCPLDLGSETPQELRIIFPTPGVW